MRSVFKTAVVAAVTLTHAAACFAGPEFSGQVRAEYIDQSTQDRGPLWQAAALAPGIVSPPGVGPGDRDRTPRQRLRHHRHRDIATAAPRRRSFSQPRDRRRAVLVGRRASWQFSAGKRIVGWDVGYGFRPNDVVEQEVRRTLLSVTPEGRALLMAEHFNADTAWSFVLVNPTKPGDQRGAEEPALAMRVYRRDGAVDWHGFARYGAHTGASIGAAACVGCERRRRIACLAALHERSRQHRVVCSIDRPDDRLGA